MLTVLRKTAELIRPDRLTKWVGMIALAGVVSLFEVVGAGIIFTLLGMAATPDATVQLPLVGDIRALFPGVDDDTLLAGLAGATALFFVLRAALVISQTYVRSRIADNAGARIASRLMLGYLRMPYAFHLQRNSAELVRNAFQTVSMVVQKVILPAASLIAECLLVAGLTIFLLVVETQATLIAGAVMGVAVTLLLRVVQPRLKLLGRRTQTASKESLKTMQQSLQGIREIRLLDREEFFASQFRASRGDYARSRYLASAASEIPRMMIETTLVIFILAFLAFTVLTVGDATETLASLGIMAYVGMRVQPSLQKVVTAANDLRFATASIDDLDEERRLLALAWQPRMEPPGDPVPEMQHQLELRDVTFTYEGADRPALDRVSLTVPAGGSVGICGPTGGGKSTLVDVMTGLLEPEEGQVLVDGVDIQRNVSSWHRQLGVVSQNVFVMDDTLRRNIALGFDDDDIDEQALQEAVSLARLEDLLGQLPRGLDTVVGERGVRMSGGQRQRVAIARALFRQPSVIVLDEGTSALDGATETAFMQGIEELREHHTLVMVAHRLSTVRKCDQIYLVEDGRIAEAGTYDELLARSATFRAMAG